MKKNKLIYIILILFVALLITGCNSKKNESSVKGIDTNKYKTDGLKLINCKTDTDTSDGVDIDIKMKVYYDKDGYLSILKRNESVTSTNESVIKEYKDAYKKLYSAYENLEYYDNVIEEKEDNVTSITYINYSKINMDELLKIENIEDYLTITNGKIKISDWKEFAKKYGTTCEE